MLENLQWHKSSRSVGNGNCVETAPLGGASNWNGFLGAIRSGKIG